MAIPERDTVYPNDGTTNRTVYTRKSSSTGWFVGIIVALALLAIGYLVFSANSGPSTTTDINNTPIVESPATDPLLTPAPTLEAPAGGTTSPMTEAPAPVDSAPATDAAPAADTPAFGAPAADAPAAEPAPVQ